jgi:hypothetical protein
MAGRRRDKGKPLKRAVSAQRLRQRLDAELADLTDPRDRVNAAADYVRAALARQPGRVDVATEVVDGLTDAGDRILNLKEVAA